MKVEESSKELSSEFLSKSSTAGLDLANFIKTYALENSLGNLQGLLGSSSKKNAPIIEQWMIVAHKLAENLQVEQDKYRRLDQ